MVRKVPSEKISGNRVIKKYLGSLKGKKRTDRAKEIASRRKNPSYGKFKTDEGVKTKPSKYTKKYKKMYGKK